MAVAQPAAMQEGPGMMLGGYAAMAESAWMGSVQATEVLEPLWGTPDGAARRRFTIPRLPRRLPRASLRTLFTREFTVAEASFVLMAGFFLSAGLGAVRQVMFNASFGVGMEADAYYAAFRLPDTLFSLIAGGALSSAMIPVLLRTQSEEGAAAARRLSGLVLTVLLLFFGGLVLAVALFTPFFVQRLLAPGFDAETSALTVTLTRIMLLQPLVLVFASVATAVLNSRNQFFLTGISVISHNVALIAGILIGSVYGDLGVLGPTIGVVLGAGLQVLILSPGLLSGGRVRLAWDWADDGLQQVIRLLVPNGLAVSVNYAGFIVDTSYATRAPEAAALPAIYNAFLMVGLPIALLGQAVGQAAFPRLAAHAEAGDWRQMRRSLLRSLGAAVALSLPVIAAFYLFGRQTVALLFERGQFGAEAGDLTFAVLMVHAVALPAYVATEVTTRGLIALRDTRTPLITNTAQLFGRALVIALLLERLGVLAIPAALAITATLETVALGAVLLIKLRRRLRGLRPG